MWLALVEHHRQLDPLYPLPPGLRAGLRAEIDRGLSRPSCAIWLAQFGGAPAGFCFAEAEPAAGPDDAGAMGWIHELWVAPEHRGRGIGVALVRRALGFLAERGNRVSVRVEAANAHALAFWRARDFRTRAHVLELDPGGPESDDGTGPAR